MKPAANRNCQHCAVGLRAERERVITPAAGSDPRTLDAVLQVRETVADSADQSRDRPARARR